MSMGSLTKDFVIKDYSADLQLLKDINDENNKCKNCDYLDFCSIIQAPSDECCEAIRSIEKQFLYHEVWNALDEYFTKKGENK